MSLFEIYKAKKLGAGAGSLFDAAIGKRPEIVYEWMTESAPYVSRIVANGAAVGSKCEDLIIGGSIAWNQMVGSEDTSVAVRNGHIYYARVGNAKSIETSDGSPLTVNGATDNVIDITLLFGKTIAQHIKSLETNHAGDGVDFFCKLFPEAHYSKSASLESVNVSARITRNLNQVILGNYKLDDGLILRGIPKINNGKVYYDGDTYESDGKVTRKYGEVDLGTLQWTATYTGYGDKYYYSSSVSDMNDEAYTSDLLICSKYPTYPSNVSEFAYGVRYRGSDKAILVRDDTVDDANALKRSLDGVLAVYKLATPIVETADAYTNPQTVRRNGNEEYVDYSVDQGMRDVSVPVGHNTKYQIPVQ